MLKHLPSLLSVTLALTGCSESQPKDLLWVGERRVDIMGVVVSDRHKDLSARLTRAIEENPAWKRYVQSVPAGEPLPYDPRCGLTRAEFDEFRELSESLSMGKAAEGTLTISSKDDEEYLLEGDRTLSHLTGIEIDLRNNVVRTSLGELKECIEVNVGDDSILGAWTGTEWVLERAATASTPKMTVKFAVGKLADSGRGVMFYRVKEGDRAGRTPIIQVVTFDLSASQ